MKKVLIIILALISVLIVAAMCRYTYGNISISRKMSEAVKAVKSGDDKLASSILMSAVGMDNANEDAYKMLAQISERASKFENAAIFWSRAAALNPLEPEYQKKMFDDILAAKSDYMLTSEYLARIGKYPMPDYLLYYAAMAFTRMGALDRRADIERVLKEKNSPYLKLLDAYKMLSRGNFLNAEKMFAECAKSGDNRLAANAFLGLAIGDLSRGNVNASLKNLADVDSSVVELVPETMILRGKIALSQKNIAEAADFFKKAAAYQRSNISLLLDLCELSVVLSDVPTIEKIRATINTNSKAALMLDYYLCALIQCVNGDYAKAAESMALCGNLRLRQTAKILEIKIACETNSVADILKLADTLPVNYPDNLKKAFASDIVKLIKKNRSGKEDIEALAGVLLKLDPDNLAALRVTISSKLAAGDYVYALDLIRNLLKFSPADKFGQESALSALMSLNRFNEGLAMSKTLADKENPEPFALAYAARFSGAVGDKKSAVSYILKLSAQSALEAGLLLDFGRYVFENGGEGDFRDFIKNIESKGGALNLSMSKLLQGEAAYSKGDKAAAKNLFAEAAKILPGYELPYMQLAIIHYLDKDFKSAKGFLDDGLKNIPDSNSLKLRKSLLLLEENTKDSLAEAEGILRKATAKSNTPPIFLSVLSAVFAAQGDARKAMDYSLEAEKREPENPEILYQLGLRLYENGRYEESLKTLARASRDLRDKRFETALEKSLVKAFDTALSAHSKKVFADSVLKLFPNNKTALSLKEKALKELEKTK